LGYDFLSVSSLSLVNLSNTDLWIAACEVWFWESPRCCIFRKIYTFSHLVYIPRGKVTIKRGRTIKHSIHISNIRYIPRGKIAIKRIGTIKHFTHVSYFTYIPRATQERESQLPPLRNTFQSKRSQFQQFGDGFQSKRSQFQQFGNTFQSRGSQFRLFGNSFWSTKTFFSYLETVSGALKLFSTTWKRFPEY